MKKILLELQRFAEGGDGGASAGTEGTAGNNVGNPEEAAKKTAKRGKSNPLQDVVYGKQEETESIADSTTEDDSNTSTKIPFEDLIKGEYKEDFDKRTQQIINKRFKESKAMEEQLKNQSSIIAMLAEKYGIDAKDTSSLTKALENDNSLYESEAMEKGLTVDQLKEVKKLERENKKYKAEKEEARQQEAAQATLKEWQQQAEQLQQAYGLKDFSLDNEIQNPDFKKMLSLGMNVETAYKAIHFNEMMGGAMAKTASAVKDGISNSIQSRQNRPAENGIKASSKVFKNDVNTLTRKDREEIARRVANGEKISFS